MRNIHTILDRILKEERTCITEDAKTDGPIKVTSNEKSKQESSILGVKCVEVSYTYQINFNNNSLADAALQRCEDNESFHDKTGLSYVKLKPGIRLSQWGPVGSKSPGTIWSTVHADNPNTKESDCRNDCRKALLDFFKDIAKDIGKDSK